MVDLMPNSGGDQSVLLEYLREQLRLFLAFPQHLRSGLILAYQHWYLCQQLHLGGVEGDHFLQSTFVNPVPPRIPSYRKREPRDPQGSPRKVVLGSSDAQDVQGNLG